MSEYNSVEPDQTIPQEGEHCFPLSQLLFFFLLTEWLINLQALTTDCLFKDETSKLWQPLDSLINNTLIRLLLIKIYSVCHSHSYLFFLDFITIYPLKCSLRQSL